MRKEPEFFIPVRESDISLGRPLKWAVYNASHDLLLKRGNVVETQAQLDLLLQEGLCREASRNDAQVINGTAAKRLEEDNASESSLHDFDDIRVSIGDIFSVQFQTDSPDSRCPVRLIGYLKNKSIVITTPEHQGGLIFAKEGQVFIVRFFSGKNAYAFTTEVLRVYNTPYPHLHLRYPARVKGLVVRKGERVAVKIICSIDLPAPADPARFAGTIQNLSTGGALIACKQAFAKKGATLVVKFRVFIGEIESLLSIDATVCSIQIDATDGILYGVKFNDIKPETQITLTAFVYQTLRETSA